MMMLKVILIVWLVCGLIGYLLYFSNKHTRPELLRFKVLALFTHLLFGPISIFYGYVCFSSRGPIMRWRQKK